MRINPRKLEERAHLQGFTPAKLAKAAGLSRQRLHAILAKESANVRKTTLQRLVGALKLPDENMLGEDPLAGYKALVADEHSELDFRGLGLAVAEPRPLDELFVPVRVRQIGKPKQERDCQGESSRAAMEQVEPSLSDGALGNLTFAECLLRQRRVLLRGDPGGGKTTCLRHAARNYARGTQAKAGYSDRPLVPLFVRLAEYAKAREQDGDISLVKFVAAQMRSKASSDSAIVVERLLENELRRGACLVLLDGLDEAGRDGNLPAVLRAFVHDWPDNHFVLTSRVIGLDMGPWERLGFATCDITRWQKEDIKQFILRWYKSRRGERGERRRREDERRAQELSNAILNRPPLREIATNPLMLTILTALHHADAALPRRRVDLYAKVVEVLLETWEAAKRDACPGDPLYGVILEPREFEWLLSRLALEMQRQDRVLAPRWGVTEFVQQFLGDSLGLKDGQAKDQGDRVIRHLCERSGLLMERGADVFGFSHLTFQEYFAARGVLEEGSGGKGDAVALLRPYLYHPRWEEVVRLVSAQLSPTHATTLIRTILDDPDPAGRFLRRGQRLALRCLADGAVVADGRLVGQVFSGGEAVGDSQWPGISLEIINALQDLKVTRQAADADRMLQDIESAARRAKSAEKFIALYEAIHGPPWPSCGANDPPGKVHHKQVGGHRFMIVAVAPRLLQEDPERWRAAVFRLLRSRKTTEPVKQTFIVGVLGDEADWDDQVRGLLEELLERDPAPGIRSACASSLQRAAAQHPSTADRLLRHLEQDESDDVKEECAWALGKVAPHRDDVRDRLTAIVEAPGVDGVRWGAVMGLRRVARQDPLLFESFVARARSKSEAPRVRVACLHVLDESLGKNPAVGECVTDCLEDPTDPLVQWVAAQIMGEALADERWPWSPSQVAKVEAVLMAVSNPCPHAWRALERLVSAKEVHGGVRLEGLLVDALAPFGVRIVVAFIFGSVARRQQNRDSDVDLLIVGDVRLKELTAALHVPEKALGRIINPVLYSRMTFRDKYQAGDPFLLEIVRGEKIFLVGDSDELTKMVAERFTS